MRRPNPDSVQSVGHPPGLKREKDPTRKPDVWGTPDHRLTGVLGYPPAQNAAQSQNGGTLFLKLI